MSYTAQLSQTVRGAHVMVLDNGMRLSNTKLPDDGDIGTAAAKVLDGLGFDLAGAWRQDFGGVTGSVHVAELRRRDDPTDGAR